MERGGGDVTYDEAKRELKRVGVSKAQGAAHLASVCEALASANPFDARMLYEGARKAGMDGRAVWQLYKAKGAAAVGDLMFT